MATLQPNQTTEKLMLLKGTRDKLATIDVTPGAIYFTTDYPGIYVDFAAEGGKEARRVRMGDVTVVDTLAELKDLATNAITEGQKLGKDTLYYAKDKNVLCIYDEDEGKFVWINDLSDLTSRVSTLEGTVGTQGTRITNIETAIGTKTTNHAATNGKTIYEAIEAEYTRATGAESNLQGQINTLKGTGTGSLGDLQTQIDNLDKAYKDADTGINTTIKTIYGNNTIPTTGAKTITGNAAAIGDLEDRLDAYDALNLGANAQENVIETIAVTLNGSADPSVTMGTGNDAKKATITLPKDLSKYDGGSVITGINNTITNDVKGSGWGTDNKKPSLMSNLAAINTINSKLSGIEAGAEVNDINTIKVSLGTPSAASDGLAISGKAVTVTVPSTLAHLQSGITGKNAETRVTDIETNITNITKTDGAINTAKQAAIDAAKTYTDGEIDKVEAALNTALAGADAMTFMGAIGYKADGNTPLLPTTGVRCGDTYVLSAESTNHAYHPGDMLIALKDQTSSSYPGTIIASGSAASATAECWFHVKTGYEGNHEARMSVIADQTSGSTTTATGNKIALTSHVAPTNTYGDLGTVEFTSTNSNIAISKTAGQNGAINFNLVWATF